MSPPGSGQVPDKVLRHLLPHEERVVTVREHPAVLAVPLGFALNAVIAAGLLTARRRKDVTALRGAWGVSGVAVFVLAVRLYAWLNSYTVVTNLRLLQVRAGPGLTQVRMTPLRKIRGLELRRSRLGRLLGYGTFVVRSATPDQKIRFLPYPEQLYLEVHGILGPESDADD